MAYVIIGCVVIAVFVFFLIRDVKPLLTHAGGVVRKQDGERTLYLLVSSSKSKNKWVLPKGKIEKNETPETTALREVREEACIRAKIIKRAGAFSYTKSRTRITVAYFLMEYEAPHNTAVEQRKVDWVEKEEAIKRMRTHGARKILRSL